MYTLFYKNKVHKIIEAQQRLNIRCQNAARSKVHKSSEFCLLQLELGAAQEARAPTFSHICM